MASSDAAKKVQPLIENGKLKAYYRTDRWTELTTERFTLDNHECVLCAKPSQVVHHRRYPEVLGTETSADLISLCKQCHYDYHFPPGMDKLSDECKDGTRSDCPLCKQKIKKLNPHRMDKQKWMVLYAMSKLHEQGQEWIKVEHGRGLVANDLSVEVRDESGNRMGHIERHVGRLKWFDLLESAGTRTGLYRVSDLGEKFLRNTAQVPLVIWCRGGHVISSTEEQVSVVDIKGVILSKEYWDRYSEGQSFESELF